MRWFSPVYLLVAALALAGSASADRAEPQPLRGEFRFARMIYANNSWAPGYGGNGIGWWAQDWPEAEDHLTRNLRRLTRLDIGDSVTLDLRSDEIFNHPWMYATHCGYWDLSDEELARLRQYLLRGGFLMVDDFWGEDEWQVVAEAMGRLFPDRPMQELHADDAMLHVVFSIDEFFQIPGLRYLQGWQIPGPSRWYGIYDDDGRLMVGINANQDVGDSWEEANNPAYPEPVTALGYRFGINYIVYAMTH
jgi:hypothetical protein